MEPEGNEDFLGEAYVYTYLHTYLPTCIRKNSTLLCVYGSGGGEVHLWRMERGLCSLGLSRGNCRGTRSQSRKMMINPYFSFILHAAPTSERTTKCLTGRRRISEMMTFRKMNLLAMNRLRPKSLVLIFQPLNPVSGWIGWCEEPKKFIPLLIGSYLPIRRYWWRRRSRRTIPRSTKRWWRAGPI